MNAHVNNILEILNNTGLGERGGALLYSGNETIAKGDWYFLGSNPGGHNDQFNEDDKVKNQLLRTNENFNEYYDGEWISKYTGTVSQPGQQEHQINIKNLFKDIGINLKKTCSTNLCFVRSRMEHSYAGDRTRDNELCWQVHEYILSIVKPKYILCNGSTSRNFISKKLSSNSNHRKMHLQLTKQLSSTLIEGDLNLRSQNQVLKNVLLFSVPHLGYYTYYPKSAEWIKNIIT